MNILPVEDDDLMRHGGDIRSRQAGGHLKPFGRSGSRPIIFLDLMKISMRLKSNI
jgi:hypothetical protein